MTLGAGWCTTTCLFHQKVADSPRKKGTEERQRFVHPAPLARRVVGDVWVFVPTPVNPAVAREADDSNGEVVAGEEDHQAADREDHVHRQLDDDPAGGFAAEPARRQLAAQGGQRGTARANLVRHGQAAYRWTNRW